MECQTTSRRALFDALRKGRVPDRPAFVPFLTGLAARAGCVDTETMFGAPSLWTSCLTAAASLFRLDGVAAGYQPGLLAKSWPVSGDDTGVPSGLEVALETVRRVTSACGRERMTAAAMTGPLTLCAELTADHGWVGQSSDLKATLTRVAEAVCQARPDLLLFAETGETSEATSPGYRRLFHTLRNVASHYDVLTGLYLEGNALEELPAYLALGCDLYLLGPAPGQEAALEALSGLDRATLAIGVGLPMADRARAHDLIDRGLRAWRSRGTGGLFFTVHEPSTGAAGPDDLHALIADIDRTGLETGLEGGDAR